MPGRDDADPLRLDGSATGLDGLDGAIGGAAEAGHFAILDDIDAERVSRSGIAPGHRIMPRHAAAPLQRRTEHRIADIPGDIERRAECLGLLGCHPFIVDAGEAVGIDMALEALHVVMIVREHQHPALRIHYIVVQRLRKPFPELHGMIV